MRLRRVVPTIVSDVFQVNLETVVYNFLFFCTLEVVFNVVNVVVNHDVNHTVLHVVIPVKIIATNVSYANYKVRDDEL